MRWKRASRAVSVCVGEWLPVKGSKKLKYERRRRLGTAVLSRWRFAVNSHPQPQSPEGGYRARLKVVLRSAHGAVGFRWVGCESKWERSSVGAPFSINISHRLRSHLESLAFREAKHSDRRVPFDAQTRR